MNDNSTDTKDEDIVFHVSTQSDKLEDGSFHLHVTLFPQTCAQIIKLAIEAEEDAAMQIIETKKFAAAAAVLFYLKNSFKDLSTREFEVLLSNLFDFTADLYFNHKEERTH